MKDFFIGTSGGILATLIVLTLVIINSPTEIKIGDVCLSCWGKP